MKMRKGYSVAIQRNDGSEFLSSSSPGVLPAIFLERRHAVKHRRELLKANFRCRVVPVKFADPECAGLGESRTIADAILQMMHRANRPSKAWRAGDFFPSDICSSRAGIYYALRTLQKRGLIETRRMDAAVTLFLLNSP